MRSIKKLSAWLKDEMTGDSYAIQSILDCIRCRGDTSLTNAEYDYSRRFVESDSYPILFQEMMLCQLQFVQLVRRGLSDLAIFEELPVPLTVFSVDSGDESEMKFNTARVQHHYLVGLFSVLSHIDLDRYIMDDYISSDPTTSKSAETDTSDKDFLSYLFGCSKSDENLRCKFFWLLRSSAISSCVKYKINQDTRTSKRPVGGDSYYLIEALISFAACLIPTNAEEDETSRFFVDTIASPLRCQQKGTVSTVLESLTVLFAPLAAAIRSHDDLSALWAILLNSAGNGNRHTCTAIATGSSSSSRSPAVINTLRHPDELLAADTVEGTARCLKASSVQADSIPDISMEDREDVDVDVDVDVDEDTAGSGDPWRDVTPPCSLLKASTVLLLCSELGGGGSDHDQRCSMQLLQSRLDFARPYLSATQQVALDHAVSRLQSKSQHKKLFDVSESGDTTQPRLRTLSSSSGDLEGYTSQCRLINAVWAATEGLRSGFSLPESCVRRNERFRESLRSSIGQGLFLQDSCIAGLKESDPGSLSPSSSVSGRNSDTVSHAADMPSKLPRVNKVGEDKEMIKDKEEDKDREREFAPEVLLSDAEPKTVQPDLQGHPFRTTFWPLPSPLHPTSVLLTGLDISRCRILRSSKYPALLVFSAQQRLPDSSEESPSRMSQVLNPLLADTQDAPPPFSSSSCGVYSSASVPYTVLFKQGDDVRQDELAVQLVRFMDRILKGAGMDLRILTYEVLSIGPREGLIEWVQGAEPLSAIVDTYSTGSSSSSSSAADASSPASPVVAYNPIQAFLRHHSPEETDEFGVSVGVMQTFLRSCAGYSVISYILGVGDRHMDNMMLMPTGHFFHVDYGYLFGRDPKPFRPLVRFTSEMLAALGGSEHIHYQEFLDLACSAFNVLRGCSAALVSLAFIMRSAGISDLSEKQGTEEALAGMLERLHPHLSDAAATAVMRNVFADGASAFMPRVMDQMHRIASTFR